jgi:CheY-like chemotaxis protein
MLKIRPEGRMKILVVDDKKENVYLLEALLKGGGYQVISASNGSKALETIRTYAEVADWNMTSYIMEQHQKMPVEIL